MTLQQLRYVIKIIETGSMTKAAEELYLSQPSLSKAVAELEKEMGITIFYRGSKGVFLSEEGSRFLSYARQVVSQADLLEEQFKHKEPPKRVFAVSSQHYSFVVNAFVDLVRDYKESRYEFSLRETRTFDIIEDVRTGRSELGIIYFSDFNRQVIRRMLKDAYAGFESLFRAAPHVFISRDHPLAHKESVTLDDLKVYPRLTFEQGVHNSFYLSEEIHSTAESFKDIRVTDRATLFNLVIGLNGYTISTGVLSSDLNGDDIIAVPLESDEIIEVGYIWSLERPPGKMAGEYLDKLKKYIANRSGLLQTGDL